MAIDWFTRGAQANQPKSQLTLCGVYLSGVGMPRDVSTATRWCCAAARGGDPAAMRILASTPRLAGVDAGARAYWMWRLASEGEARYESMLGDAYDLGDGVAVDYSAAVYWFRKAAEQGDVSAQGSLAWHLLTGLGGERDERQAFEWATRAANGGPRGKEIVGAAYLSGRGVAADATVSRTWFEKAAAGGESWAVSDIARLYEMGAGVPHDDLVAVTRHRKAAAKGVDTSEIALALRALVTGDVRGLRASEAYWLIDDASLNEACRTGGNRSTAAQAGESGQVEWDALSCLNEALLVDAMMQYELGVRYLTGDGVAFDRALGDAWLRRAQMSFAAEPGFSVYAKATRIVEARVAARLSADERERAGRLADHLLATVPGSLAAAAATGTVLTTASP